MNKNDKDIFSTSSKLNDDFIIGDDFFSKSSDRAAAARQGGSAANSKISKAKLKQKRKVRIAVNVLLSVVLAFSTLWAGTVFAVDYFLGDMTYNDITDNHSDLGINDEVADKLGIGHIKNIAMFGIDSRNPKSTKGRSDTIIILSVNTKNNSIKMTSILRDSYVAIDGHGKEKITHAYAYGGPVLAIKTINQNFHLNIKDYVSVNFAQLSAVLDVMDGIDLEITEAERRELNRIMESENFTSTPVAKSGMVHLNGIQAMHFARIRKIDGDDARAERQGKVLNCLFEKVKTMSASKYPALLKTIMPNVETSLSYSDIIGYAPMMAKGDLKLERSLVPDTKLDKPIGGNYDGAWVWRYDLNAASNRMHEWIYGDEIEK